METSKPAEMTRKELSEATMRARVSQGQFRFADLYIPFGANSPEYREADRLIQRLRKSGHIRMVKHGLWEAAPPVSISEVKEEE